MVDFVESMDTSDPMKPEPNGQASSQFSTLVTQGTLSPSSILKKTSPLKHITPIIKKYNCQRQAKNGKSVKLKSQGKKAEEEHTIQNPTPVQDLVAGMDSLDAALRRAEKCIAGGKDEDHHADVSVEHAVEPNVDDSGDGEEESIGSSHAAINQQNSSNARSSQLRNRNRVLKKRNQLQKDLEHTLPLAAPDQSMISEEKSYGFSVAFFQKVRDRFETQNSIVFKKFMDLLHEHYFNTTDLYHRVMELFKGHPDLCEDFLGFLLPHQAIQCGKFMEHLAFSEMSSFLHKLELYFAKQPQHLKKIHASWARLAEAPDLTLETVRSSILPLLRGNTFLVDSFLALLPSEKPPESKMTDFDQVLCKDTDNELAEVKETFERVEIPPENDDPFGGENCQCCCHNSSADPAFISRTKHCVPCGMKFISGKVYLHTEHGLRPGRIDFIGGGNNVTNVKRLNADHQKLSRSRPRRGQGNTSQITLRAEDCKAAVETDDEAVFSSKIKSPRQRPKIPKHPREKPSSARSLSLNRSACSRKPPNSKISSSPLPVINDQEAQPATSPSEDEKPSTLDFSTISDVIRMDHDQTVPEVLYERNSDRCGALDSAKDSLKEETNEDVVMQVSESEACKKDNVPKHKLVGSEKDKMLSENNIIVSDRNKMIDSEKISYQEERIKTLEEEVEGKSDKDIVPEDLSVDEIQTVDGVPEANADVPGASSDCGVDDASEVSEEVSWTKTEDRIILCTFQSEPDQGKALGRVSAQLPHRTIDEISSRLQFLVNFIQRLQNG